MNRNILVIVSSLMVIIGTVVVAMWPVDPQVKIGEESNLSGSTKSVTGEVTASPDPGEIDRSSTIATKWQWKPVDTELKTFKENDAVAPMPFTPQSVHDALQSVRIDKNGDLILDHLALISLDETLGGIHSKLDSESLFSLQNLIKEYLHGDVGEQTAQIVNNYYQYLGAQDEFYQIQVSSVRPEPSLDAIKYYEVAYADLQDLRSVYLGNQTSESLFRESNAKARYMFEKMKLQHETGLTQEEVNAKHQEIEAQLAEELGRTESEPIG